MGTHPGRLWYEAELERRSHRIRDLRLEERANRVGGKRLRAENFRGRRLCEEAHYERLVDSYLRGRFFQDEA